MKSLHDKFNITFSNSYYKKFCAMKKDEKRKVLELMTVFNHLGSKRKNEEIEKIINATPYTSTARKKVRKNNTSTNTGGNAKDLSNGQEFDKTKN